MVNIVLSKIEDEYSVAVIFTGRAGLTSLESKEVTTSLPFALGLAVGTAYKYNNAAIMIPPNILADIMWMMK